MDRVTKKINTSAIVLAGLLSAISIIFTRFFALMIAGNTIRLSFGDIPLELSGILLGPVFGALTGVVADVAGSLVRSYGPYFPGFTLSSALMGIIPALFFINAKEKISLWKIAAAVITTNIVVSLGLNTLWLSIMFKKAFIVLLPGRLLTRAIMIPIEIFSLYIITRKLRLK